MKKLLFLLLIVAAFILSAHAPTAEAAYNGTNTFLSSSSGGSSFYIPGTFPFTFGGWVNPSSVTANTEEILFTDGRAGGSGWKVEAACANGTCGCTGTPVSFVKLTVVVICSTHTLSLNVWQFVAMVVSSTKVHFVFISAAGAVTTQDVNDSSAVVACSSTCILQIQGETSGNVVPGSVANVAVWQSALSDDELKAFAFQGLSAVGRQPALFIPMFNTAASVQAQGDLATGNVNFLMTAQFNPTTSSHSPTASPFVRH